MAGNETADAGSKSAKDIGKWYARQYQRIIDLVGDYAGQDMFLIEGDSLVLQCIDDSKVDFEGGFQILHFVWNIERFLEKLLRAGCNFHVVFFDDHRDYCVPTNKSDVYIAKHTLAREIAYEHLMHHVREARPEIGVRSFDTPISKEFMEYAEFVNFVLCHNGASAIPADGEDASLTTFSDSYLFAMRRLMGLKFNIALINEINWRDMKVITRVIERIYDGSHVVEIGMPTNEYDCIHHEAVCRIKNTFRNFGKSQMSARERLGLAVLAELVNCNPDEVQLFFAGGYLLHLACLKHLPLAQRRIPDIVILSRKHENEYNAFMLLFCRLARSVIRDRSWKALHSECMYDVHDLMDGRLLRFTLHCISNQPDTVYPEVILSTFDLLGRTLGSLCKLETAETVQFYSEIFLESDVGKHDVTPLPPLENKYFNALMPRSGCETNSPDCDWEGWSSSARKRLDAKVTSRHQLIGKANPSGPITKWRNPARHNQLQMLDIARYAESLVDGKRKVVVQEVIAPADNPQNKQESRKSKQIKAKNRARTADKSQERWLAGWRHQVSQLEAINSPDRRFTLASEYLEDISDREKRLFLEPEIHLYMLRILLIKRNAHFKYGSGDSPTNTATRIWDLIRELRKCSHRLTLESSIALNMVCVALGLPEIPAAKTPPPHRALVFDFGLENMSRNPLSGQQSLQKFQLMYCGPYMDRHTNAEYDARVGFSPDKWQRDVLDALDAKQSVFVVAPTSAGKTFISFYAMSQVLREGNDGVIVYVAPTKALVNQIAAEVHGRFSKRYPTPDRTIWSIYTRDHRVNNPKNCQILVTVPEILLIMLLAPQNADTWVPRLRYIIFDEIHSIGNTETGVVWEQLLLLAPCRIIALSATVGNPEGFSEWLASTQETLGFSMKTIIYKHRYSDLRKYIYTPPKEFYFKGLQHRPTSSLSKELDVVPELKYVHPVHSLANRPQGVAGDLDLEPRDCLLLWNAMRKLCRAEFEVPRSLMPTSALPAFMQRSDVFEWEANLKKVLSKWMANSQSPFDKLRHSLGHQQMEVDTIPLSDARDGFKMERERLRASVLPLVERLHNHDALPAILFNFDRYECEEIGAQLLEELKAVEEEYKCGPVWKRKIKEFEDWKTAKVKEARYEAKVKKIMEKKKKGSSSEERQSKDDRLREELTKDVEPFASFKPDMPLEEFSFANHKVMTWSELEDDLKHLNYSKIKPWLIEALKRGIATHHAGMNRRYRLSVERLFRRGFLRVVVATGTLALGINMPCPTVVFCGDNLWLSSLNFKQCAGRAGRRGFDLLGNVIFHGIPQRRVLQLMSSQLPRLIGHFPITTGLILRLCILLHESGESLYAVHAIKVLLSQTRLYMGGDAFQAQVQHHIQFSMDYLRRQRLLGRHGEPINLASYIARLQYTENGCFAFHSLLEAGYFRDLCAGGAPSHNRSSNGERKMSQKLMRTLMLVLAHLFGRRPLDRRYNDEAHREIIRKSPSYVVMPPIPERAACVLQRHNINALETLETSLDTFVTDHLEEPERELPLSRIKTIGAEDMPVGDFYGCLEPTRLRSAFAALSGHGDHFDSVQDICETGRAGLLLEASAVPHLEMSEDLQSPLNAYLYDFFNHGAVKPLETANGIRSSDVWYLLNDFSLILGTITAVFADYLGLNEGEELDQLIVGVGDDDGGDDSNATIVGGLDGDYAQVGMQSDTDRKQKRSSAKMPSADEVPEIWDTGFDSGNDGLAGNDHSGMDVNDEAYHDGEEVVTFAVYLAFRQLQLEFNEKFRKIFA